VAVPFFDDSDAVDADLRCLGVFVTVDEEDQDGILNGSGGGELRWPCCESWKS
jgi:hypothetical protein